MTMVVFRGILVAFALLELQHFTAKVTASPTPADTTVLLPSTAVSPLPLQYETRNATKREKKILLRKCCGSGQVYHAGSRSCISYSISSHTSKQQMKIPQQLFLQTDQHFLQYADEDFEVENGFPRDCPEDSLLYLEPDILMSERFYLVESGQLILPHRFWYFQHEDYCIEELFKDNDLNKAKRIACVCGDRLNRFPSTAISEDGKLQLDFIDSTASSVMSSIVGKTVVRKCCDQNAIFSLDKRACVSDQQELKTQFFEDLQARENDSLFFRVGLLDCEYYSLNTLKFEVTSSGSLQVEVDETGHDWKGQLFSTDNYCVDDFVITNSVGLPGSANLALFCSEELPQLPEHDEQPIDSGSINEIRYEELKQINAPKCCASNSVIKQETCQPLNLVDKTLDAESIVTDALNFYLLDSFNFASNLTPNASLSCGFSKKYPLIPSSGNNNQTATTFKSFGESGNLSLMMHIFEENYWDFDLQLQSFCIDLELVHSLKEAAYQSQVFYCISKSNVAGHYPILLGISSAALLATFIIYFFVPTSGSAKLVTLMGGSNKRRNTVPTMAMMLTGRILLCHVFTLAVTFISLAISQDGRAFTGETSCIVLGYFSYGASIASFSWLTVYCFDYCRIFRGSFKVSNEMLFIPYSLFGWGIPLLALVSALVVQFQSTHYGISSNVNPNMGIVRCWFAGGMSSLIFFYIPVSILMFLNVIFFLSLLFNPNLMNCWKKNRTTPLRTNRNSTKESKEKQDIKMAVKLFFITGVPWVFEIVAWLPAVLPDFLRQNSKYFLEVSNLLNSLRGVIIFVIFIVLQRDVRRYLGKPLERFFVSEDNSKMDSRSRSNGESISASTHQSQTTIGTNRISNSNFRVTPVNVTSEEDEKIAKSQPEFDEVTYL